VGPQHMTPDEIRERRVYSRRFRGAIQPASKLLRVSNNPLPSRSLQGVTSVNHGEWFGA